MQYMFCESRFNQDISKWNVSNVCDMRRMFSESRFNQDISNWNINASKWNLDEMFDNCPIKEEYKPT